MDSQNIRAVGCATMGEPLETGLYPLVCSVGKGICFQMRHDGREVGLRLHNRQWLTLEANKGNAALFEDPRKMTDERFVLCVEPAHLVFFGHHTFSPLRGQQVLACPLSYHRADTYLMYAILDIRAKGRVDRSALSTLWALVLAAYRLAGGQAIERLERMAQDDLLSMSQMIRVLDRATRQLERFGVQLHDSSANPSGS